MNFDNYECEGQMELDEYFMRQIKCGKVMSISEWVNASGNSQHEEIKEIIKENIINENTADKIASAILEYILEKSSGYMEYLKTI